MGEAVTEMQWLWAYLGRENLTFPLPSSSPHPTPFPGPVIKPQTHPSILSWDAGAGTVPDVSMAPSIGGTRECKTGPERKDFMLSACCSFLAASPHNSHSLWQKQLVPVTTGSNFQVFSTFPEPASSWPLRYISTNPRRALLRALGPHFQVLITSSYSLVLPSLRVVSVSCSYYL